MSVRLAPHKGPPPAQRVVTHADRLKALQSYVSPLTKEQGPARAGVRIDATLKEYIMKQLETAAPAEEDAPTATEAREFFNAQELRNKLTMFLEDDIVQASELVDVLEYMGAAQRALLDDIASYSNELNTERYDPYIPFDPDEPPEPYEPPEPSEPPPEPSEPPPEPSEPPPEPRRRSVNTMRAIVGMLGAVGGILVTVLRSAQETDPAQGFSIDPLLALPWDAKQQSLAASLARMPQIVCNSKLS